MERFVFFRNNIHYPFWIMDMLEKIIFLFYKNTSVNEKLILENGLYKFTAGPHSAIGRAPDS